MISFVVTIMQRSVMGSHDFFEVQTPPRGLRITSIVILVFTTLLTAVISLAVVAESTSVFEDLILIVVMTIFVPALILLWLNAMRLEVVVDTRGVHVRIRRMMRKPRTYTWDAVDKVTLRRMNVFGEFGGWGLRYALNGKKGYVLNGSHGLELRLLSGKRVVISIVDNNSLQQTLDTLKLPDHD
jgi:heme/copper-type cytochrome/quinol oxidase subunit 2